MRDMESDRRVYDSTACECSRVGTESDPEDLCASVPRCVVGL